MIKRMISVSLVFCMGFCLVACNSSKESNAGSSNTTPDQSTTAGSSNTGQTAEHHIGDAVSMDDGTELTVLSVERDYYEDFLYRPAAEGCEFIKVTVQLDNVSDESAHYNIFAFGVLYSYDSSDLHTNIDNGDDPNQFGMGDLEPGESVSGTVVFEVPQGDTDLWLFYKPSLTIPSVLIKL